MKICFVGDFVPSKPTECGLPGVAVGNLECAFSDVAAKCGKAYASVLPKSCMENVGKGGFAALSLANNHVNDAGNFAETYAELKARFPGVQFFGTVEKPFAEFWFCRGECVASGEKCDGAAVRVIVVGCLEPCRSRGKNVFRQEDVASLVRRLRASPSSASTTFVYVYPHWGKEGEYTRWPSPMQRKLAREWIDAGADGVIGNHSHVPQGMELCKGKPIYYSLGNWFFEGAVDLKIPESADRMAVCVEDGRFSERFAPESARDGFVEACATFGGGWTRWRWASVVGPFYLAKNMASWRVRLRKNPAKNLPKFVVWQFLPQVLLFRLASLFGKGGGKCCSC